MDGQLLDPAWLQFVSFSLSATLALATCLLIYVHHQLDAHLPAHAPATLRRP